MFSTVSLPAVLKRVPQISGYTNLSLKAEKRGKSVEKLPKLQIVVENKEIKAKMNQFKVAVSNKRRMHSNIILAVSNK